MRLGPIPAALLVVGLAATALLARRVETVGVIALVLFAVCVTAPARRKVFYLVGAIGSGVGIFVFSPFLGVIGTDPLWTGPVIPVLGPLDVTEEELRLAALNGLRLTAVALAFSAYALRLDHDALLGAAGFARRWAVAAALATRLVPSLERDAAGLSESVRGRGLKLAGVRGHAMLLSPLVAGSLERALNLAEAMEARGFGAAGRTRAFRPAWRLADRLAVVAAAVLVGLGALWL